MSRPVIAITHAADAVGRHYTPADLARLEAVAEVRVLGSNKPQDILGKLGDVRILTGSWGMPKLTPELLAAAPQLTAVCYAAGTVKGFVTDASYARGVTITTAMHANAIPVAEVTFALITLANKDWFTCQDTMRRDGEAGRQRLYQDRHRGNYGATVAIIGLGAIGRLVCERLKSLVLDVVAYDPYAPDALFAELGARRAATPVEAVRGAQVVSLHAPDIPATNGMCDAAFFAAMADGATFINTARGRLVVEDALIAELRTGRIKALLDVTHPEPPAPDSPLWTLPNCWLTPHRAGSSADEIRRMGTYAVDECLRHLRGEAPKYGVTQAMLATMA